MKTSWNAFLKRRNIDIGRFLSTNGIGSRADLLAHLASIEVNPPDDEEMRALFPPEITIERIDHQPVPSLKTPVSVEPTKQTTVREKPKGKNK
jgi:hypothetical protein